MFEKKVMANFIKIKNKKIKIAIKINKISTNSLDKDLTKNLQLILVI